MLMPITNWNEKTKIAIPGNAEETLKFCALHFIKAYQKAVQEKGSFQVALSGGSTPKALFSLLTKQPYSLEIDWSKVHLFWSDERSVGPENSESNYHMAMEAGFSLVNIPPVQIHRMIAEDSIEKNALDYENLLKKDVSLGFDYLMLGMGEDGHTASLFPGTTGLHIADRWVIANYIPQKNTWRMTLTFTCINQAKNIVIYVLGKAKQEKTIEIFSSKEALFPIQNVGSQEHPALWIMDNEAAPSIIRNTINNLNS